eukprot:7416332-Pyramimonas_sp.AAC.1
MQVTPVEIQGSRRAATARAAAGPLRLTQAALGECTKARWVEAPRAVGDRLARGAGGSRRR